MLNFQITADFKGQQCYRTATISYTEMHTLNVIRCDSASTPNQQSYIWWSI